MSVPATEQRRWWTASTRPFYVRYGHCAICGDTRPAVTVQHVAQVNIGGQQVNMAGEVQVEPLRRPRRPPYAWEVLEDTQRFRKDIKHAVGAGHPHALPTT